MPLAALSSVGLVAARRPVKTPACAIAAAWASAHRAQLPTSLKAYLAYSPTYRRAVYRELSATVRVALWREHFDEISRNHALNPEQRTLLTYLATRLPELVGDRTGATGRAIITREHLDARVKAAFPDFLASAVESLDVPPGTASETSRGTRAAATGKGCECSQWYYVGDPACNAEGLPYCEAPDPDNECAGTDLPLCGAMFDFPCDGQCKAG